MRTTVYSVRLQKLGRSSGQPRFGFASAEDRAKFIQYAKRKGWAVKSISEPSQYSLKDAKDRLDGMSNPGPEEARRLLEWAEHQERSSRRVAEAINEAIDAGEDIGAEGYLIAY